MRTCLNPSAAQSSRRGVWVRTSHGATDSPTFPVGSEVVAMGAAPIPRSLVTGSGRVVRAANGSKLTPRPEAPPGREAAEGTLQASIVRQPIGSPAKAGCLSQRDVAPARAGLVALMAKTAIRPAAQAARWKVEPRFPPVPRFDERAACKIPTTPSTPACCARRGAQSPTSTTSSPFGGFHRRVARRSVRAVTNGRVRHLELQTQSDTAHEHLPQEGRKPRSVAEAADRLREQHARSVVTDADEGEGQPRRAH